jgi:HAMP domain-containing protein
MKLKSKFAFIISLLIILVIGSTSAILIQQQKTELENDIYINARSFGELTAEDISVVAGLYLPQESFVPFKRDLTEILKKNADILGVKIYSFSGNVLYNYEEEENNQYSGTNRLVEDQDKLTRIKSSNISVINEFDQIFYLVKQEAGVYKITDENQKELSAEESPDFSMLKNIIIPVNNEFAVEYDISYQNLTDRLIARAQNIAMIAAIGFLVSVVFALLLAGLVTTPISKLSVTVGEIAKGEFNKRSKVKSKDEVGDLAQSVNKMARDLEKATEAKIYQERVKKELEIAGEIQKNILPKELPTIKGVEVSAQLIPATEVGGDVYDVLQDKKGDSYFYVGDVTGHGVPAGLLSALTNAILTSTINDGKLEDIMDNLNRVLRMKTPGNLFLTLILMKLVSSDLQYVSAGHEQVIHYIYS